MIPNRRTAQQGKEADRDERLANDTEESGLCFDVDVLVSLACLLRSQNRPGRMGANGRALGARLAGASLLLFHRAAKNFEC